MNAGDVKAALRRYWPTTEYVTLEEASLDSARNYASADFVAISAWASRGYEIDAVEVKVSYGDWVRERDNPAKSALWRFHCHRWWVAAPAKLAERIKPELPAGWGLLAVDGLYSAVVVKAAKQEPTPLPWRMVVGLLRSAQDCGIAALERAERRGYEQATRFAEVPAAEAAKAESWLSRRRVPDR